MGLGDLISKVLIEVKADTSDAKAKIKELTGEEKKLAEQRLAGMDAGNKSIDGFIGKLGQLGVALGVAKVAADSFSLYAHQMDLQSAAAGVSIEGLAKAAHGLKTNLQLTEEAARLNKSAFHLTQQQMETAETAMRALEARGHSSAEVWAAFEPALTKGVTEPLERLIGPIDKAGLAFDENGLKLDTLGQKQKAVQRIFEAFGKTAKEVEGEQMNAADATSQQIVRLQNLWDSAKLKLGELVADIGSKLLPVLANSIERAAKLVSMLTPDHSDDTKDFIFGGGVLKYQDQAEKSVDKFFGTESISAGTGIKNAIEAYKAEQAARPLYATDAIAFGQSQVSGEVDVGKFQGALTSLYQFSVKFDEYQKRKAGSGAGGGASSVSSLVNLGGFGAGRAGSAGSLGQAAGTGLTDQYGAPIALQDIIDNVNKEQNTALTQDWFKRLGEQQNKRKSFLESTFGPIEDFNAYAKGFEMLTGAVTTGMNAWIDGSMSAGKALRGFFADAIKGAASQMAVEALKHTAFAIGSLAFGDVGGATKHAAAALAFGAGAAAAAVTAKELGGGANVPKAGAGGSSASAGSSGGSYGGSAGNGTQQQPARIVVIQGDAFASDSPRERQITAEKAFERAFGSQQGVAAR